MSPDDVRSLYALIVSYDNRKASEANMRAWWEQATRNRWTLAEALDAVREHHATSTDYLMPGHVAAIIRRRRAQPATVDVSRRIDGPPPADPERVRAIVDRIRAGLPEPGTHTKAIMRARSERGHPSRAESAEPLRKRKRGFANPQTPEAAALARRYLADGYDPPDVSERLAISKRWCYRQAPGDF